MDGEQEKEEVDEKDNENEDDEKESLVENHNNHEAREEHLPVEERRRDEERWRTQENLHRFTHGNVSEALRKHFDSILLHENVFFLPKIAEMHSLGVMNIFETAPLPYL